MDTKKTVLISYQIPEFQSLIIDCVNSCLKHHHFKHYDPTTEQPEQWLDLNELIKYDPEKRTKPTWYSKI